MFVYFPEYAYNKIRSYLKYSFNATVTEKSAKDLLEKKLSNGNLLLYLEEFSNKKLKLPKIQLKHCKAFNINETEVNLGIISSYDRVDNKIKICKNYVGSIEQLSEIIDKEIVYALEINSLKGRISLNDLATLSIKACAAMKNKLDNKNTNIDSNLLTERIKRCAMLDFKYKNISEIKAIYEEEYDYIDNLKLNEIVSKLIDQNMNKLN